MFGAPSTAEPTRLCPSSPPLQATSPTFLPKHETSLSSVGMFMTEASSLQTRFTYWLSLHGAKKHVSYNDRRDVGQICERVNRPKTDARATQTSHDAARRSLMTLTCALDVEMGSNTRHKSGEAGPTRPPSEPSRTGHVTTALHKSHCRVLLSQGTWVFSSDQTCKNRSRFVLYRRDFASRSTRASFQRRTSEAGVWKPATGLDYPRSPVRLVKRSGIVRAWFGAATGLRSTYCDLPSVKAVTACLAHLLGGVLTKGGGVTLISVRLSTEPDLIAFLATRPTNNLGARLVSGR
ncbi:hypothetical protein Bbelb_267110 [Branchiostoma belcheri]|nr:hypothetical protein Bbelb_267110 [Branchiostoma belcheri]